MSDPIIDSLQMEGETLQQQCVRAIRHTLLRIREDATIGYVMGLGSQTFALLTEAYATATQTPVRQVREIYMPQNARDPHTGVSDLVEACQRLCSEWDAGDDISVGCMEDARSALAKAVGKEGA